MAYENVPGEINGITELTGTDKEEGQKNAPLFFGKNGPKKMSLLFL